MNISVDRRLAAALLLIQVIAMPVVALAVDHAAAKERKAISMVQSEVEITALTDTRQRKNLMDDLNGVRDDGGDSIGEDFSCIKIGDPNYVLKQVMPTALGLPSQMALLPNEDVLVTDPNNNRIVVVSDNSVRTLVAGKAIMASGVAVLPDGRAVYNKEDGLLMAIDPENGIKTVLGSTGVGGVPALAVDQAGNIYVTPHRAVYRCDLSANCSAVATGLPFDVINDLDIGVDGTVYVGGYSRVIAIDANGTVRVVADGLNYEPVWISVAPTGVVFIHDNTQGLQMYDPTDQQLAPADIPGFGPAEILFPTANEMIGFEGQVLYRFNLKNHTSTPLLVISGNSYAFAADADDTVFFSTPSKQGVLDSHIIRLQSDGARQDLDYLTYPEIWAADVDYMNRLCLYTHEDFRFQRAEANNTITSIRPNFSENPPEHLRRFAVGPDGLWYVITSDFENSIQVYRFDDLGNVTFLPISFTPATFGDARLVSEASIDIGNDGRLALIVTANKVWGQGPVYQRVFRAYSDGTDLTEVARLDSERLGGPVDIAIGPDGDIFVLSVQRGGDPIYRIGENKAVTKFVDICGGDDPSSIDVDPSGTVWFSTERGIYRAVPK